MMRRLALFGVSFLLFLLWEGLPNVAVLAQSQSVTRQVKRKVPPEYPEIAKRMNLTGKVRIEVVISADGRVKFSRPLGGHPVLVQAAETAMKNWKFVPASGETIQVLEMEFAGTEVH
jgi:TonB family protein